MNDIKREIIEEYLQKTNKTALDVEDVLYLLEENEYLQYAVKQEYDHNTHLLEIDNEIDFINKDRETPLEIDDETRHAILEQYECNLDNDEYWYNYLIDAIKKNVDIED